LAKLQIHVSQKNVVWVFTDVQLINIMPLSVLTNVSLK